MEYNEYIEMGLNGDAALKIIMRGYVKSVQGGKAGIVEVVFATTNKSMAREKIEELNAKHSGDYYYMVYSVPLDVDLTSLAHYPSIAITKNDLAD